jgi:hypothetical protein
MTKNKMPSKASYLSNCDLINKYSFCQSEKIPFLTKVILRLTSVDILNAIENSNQNDSNSETRIRFFLIIYIFKLFQPKIYCETSTKNKGIEKKFSLQISFTTKKEICKILTVLFTENWRPIFENSVCYDKGISNFKMSAETFLGIKKFLEKNMLELDSNKLRINCKLVFKNKSFRNKIVSAKMIKNIAPFWISC